MHLFLIFRKTGIKMIAMAAVIEFSEDIKNTEGSI